MAPPVTKDLNAPSPEGILTVALVQSGTPLDPVTVSIYYLNNGIEILVGTAVVAPPAGPGQATRVVAFAEVSAATQWRVRANNGTSPEALDVNLKHGQVSALALVQGPVSWVVPVTPVVSSGQPNYVWLSPNGNDATAMRGNVNFPAATPARAVELAQEEDTIIVAPGTYPPYRTTFEANRRNRLTWLALADNGPQNRFTKFAANDGAPALSLAPATPDLADLVRRWSFYGIDFEGGPGPVGVNIAGNNAADGTLFFDDGIHFEDCTANGAVLGFDFRTVGEVAMKRCTSQGLGARLTNVGRGVLQNGESFQNLTVAYDSTLARPSTGRNPIRLESFKVGAALQLTGQARVSADAGVKAASLTTALTTTGPANEAHELVYRGEVGGVTLFFPDNAGPQAIVDLDSAVITGEFTSSAVDPPVIPGRFAVSAQGAVFKGATTAGNRIDLDMMGASYRQANLSSAGAAPGTIKCQSLRFGPVAAVAVVTPQAITPPGPDGDYIVTAEHSDDSGNTKITNKLGTGFDHQETLALGSMTFLVSRT